MGYCRRGSKYRNNDALCKFLKLRIVLLFVLVSGSPGFSNQRQLTGYYGGEANYFYFLFCDWKTSWSLLYRPIDGNEIKIIDKIIQVLKYVFDTNLFNLEMQHSKYSQRVQRDQKHHANHFASKCYEFILP